MTRTVSAHRDGMTHLGIISSGDVDVLDVVVGETPIRLPVRLVCEVAKSGRTPRGPGSVSAETCSNADVDCMTCLVAWAREVGRA